MEVLKNSFEEYKAMKHLNCSTLKLLLDDKDMYHLRDDIYSDKQSDSMKFGSLVHAMFLELETVPKLYTSYPPDHKGTTKEGKALVAEIKEKGLTAFSNDIWMKAHKQCQILKKHGYSKRMVAPEAKQEITYTKVIDNISFKCRVDAIDKNTIYDLKTTKQTTFEKFCDDIFEYHYDMQAHLYKMITGVEGFVFVGISTVNNKVFVVKLDVHMERIGKHKVDQAIENYKEVTKINYEAKPRFYSATKWVSSDVIRLSEELAVDDE